MSAKTANVMARVEPEIKETAESIIASLGLSASGVINMLYRQIILKNGIPFPVTLTKEPNALDELTKTEFDAMLEVGYSQAKQKKGKSADEVFTMIRGKL